MRRLILLVPLMLLAIAVPSAQAAPGVIEDFAGCHANSLGPNDDESSDAVPLGFTAHMFDTTFSSVFVNNNGNVTVSDALSEYTPFDFRESGQTMIAPFFADVDTTEAGDVDYGPITYGGQPAFCVIWDHVGYFNSHDDKLNTFQLIIADEPPDKVRLVFNYDSIAWETGDVSGGHAGLGGTSAVAGYASGDGDSAHALMLPGSFVNGGLLDSNPATSLAGHATAGQAAGRYVYLLVPGTTGARLTGKVTDPGGQPVSGALVQICRDGGACVTRITSNTGDYAASGLVAGSYDLTAFSGPNRTLGPARANDVAVPATGTVTKDLQLAPLPPPPPDGTTITSFAESDDGLPVAFWTDPLDLVTEGCADAVATYTFVLEGHSVASGPLTESPAGSGLYRATIPAVFPNHGDGVISIHFDCPVDPDEDIEFGIYIDPSGLVRDENGQPLADATVTLQRSADPAGPFFTVPDGSVVMSPANRTNPDRTGADGRFGWDVVAGYYKVAATKPGCVSLANPAQAAATSGVLTIPPPVTNLDLRLDCTPPLSGGGGGGGGGPATPPGPTPPRKLATFGKIKLSKGKTLTVPLACAKTASIACAGKVTVKLGKKVVGSRTYKKIKPGKTVKVRVTLSKKGRARIAKLKKGKKFKLVVTATVKDAAGKGATAKKTITLKR